jgi:hypothetical protein
MLLKGCTVNSIRFGGEIDAVRAAELGECDATAQFEILEYTRNDISRAEKHEKKRKLKVSYMSGDPEA